MASNRRILVFGHGDKSDSGFPSAAALDDFIRSGVAERRNRYHHTLRRNADIVVLSRDGFAHGDFEILDKVVPDKQDLVEYPQANSVYIVGKRTLYQSPVKLMPLGLRVHQRGLPISEAQLQEIRRAGGKLQSFQQQPIGWRPSPDRAHNAAVEEAAIACVLGHLGLASRDRQKDNCGWDLEFEVDDRELCVEVKGVSGSDVAVELTPNEYRCMKKVMDGAFTEGDYRLAVVCEALSASPSFLLFKHEKEWVWRCERSGRQITAKERTAARLS